MKKRTAIISIILGIALISSAIFCYSYVFAPKTPKKIQAQGKTYDTILIKWKSAKNANKYEVYRKDSKDSDFKPIDQTSKKQFVDSGVKTGKKYTYKVLSMKDNRKGKFSKEITVSTGLDTPNLTVSTKSGKIKVTVTKVPGADGYVFYRNGKLASKQADVEYVDKGAKADSTYLYTAKAYRYNKDSVYSSPSAQRTAKLISPGKLTAKCDEDNLILEWKGDKQYNKYNVYRNDQLLDTVDKNSFSTKEFETNTPYTFKIVGVSKDNTKSPPATRKLQIETRPYTNEEAREAACKWAVDIANDDSFTYGAGQRAHRYGCYFCGTNLMKKGSGKVDGHSYEKTYCCNPFVHAAYSHGAEDQKMLAACQAGGGIAMSEKSFTRYGNWEKHAKPKKSDLEKGDVIVKKKHVTLYIGNGQIVNATTKNWSPESIAVQDLSDGYYSSFDFVMRYTGVGSKVHNQVKYL